MPSKKVLAVLIISLAGVFSSFLIAKTPSLKEEVLSARKSNEDSVTANPYEKITQNTNDDWKKILTDVDTKNNKVVSLVKNASQTPEDTTLTSQLTKEVMSRYLSLKNGGRSLSEEDVVTIIRDIASDPKFIKPSAPLYVSSNLKPADNSINSIAYYKKSVTSIIRNSLFQIKDDPSYVVVYALQNDSESSLKYIDPTIALAKKGINDLLNLAVPKEAVDLHLKLINSISNMLENLESLRVVFSDPVKGLSGIKFYDEYKTNFVNSINEMSEYLSK
jgi:hypothetical protein